jgi:two-component system sensor histidine kinase KdpD
VPSEIRAIGALAAITLLYSRVLFVTNQTTVALTFLLVVLVVATTSPLRAAVVTSIAAMLVFNYFFLPPFGTFRIADPENWVALFTFLAVSLVASNLSSVARRRAEETVRLMGELKDAEIARRSEELKSALLASLGHDLRTPLTAIRVAATNLQASWLTDPQRREQTDLVLSEVERLTRLFQNILDMARIDAGAVGTDVQWVHPSEIVEAARDLVVHTLAGRLVDARVVGDHLVKVDPRLTASALAQLLDNAAKYSPAGSPITVSAVTDGDGLTVTVRDEGQGIAPADLPHLFDRFYRGHQVRPRVSGTGMGLSIARGVLAVQHGRIWAENRPDGGAQFTIQVPADVRAMDVPEQVT